jgi:hypothetical protein
MVKHIKEISILFILVLSFQFSKPAHAKSYCIPVSLAIAISVSFSALLSSAIAYGINHKRPYCPDNLSLESRLIPYPCLYHHRLETCYEREYFCIDPKTKAVKIDPAPMRHGIGKEIAKWAMIGSGASLLVFLSTTVALIWKSKQAPNQIYN